MARKIRGKYEGSISQRPNGKWRAQISIGGGKRENFQADTKQEAQEWLRRKLVQIDNGLDIAGSKISSGEYLHSWLDKARPALREKTAFSYQKIIEKHLVPGIGKIPLKDLNQARIEQFYADMLQRGIGTRTVRLSHSILHRALEKAVMYSLIVRNPAHGATLPRKRQQEITVWDDSQALAFLAAASGSRHEALYHLAAKTGLRQGEIFGLKWSDLQWSAGVLHVQRQVQRVPGKGWSFVEPKTKAGRRTVRLGPALLDILRRHKERQELERAVVGKRWQNLNLIFPNKVGNPLEPSNLRLDFNRLLEEVGLPKIRFHDLRHTAASLMLNHNIPIMVVSGILGHSKPSVTLDIYGHLYHQSQDAAAQLMEDLITPTRIELPKPAESEAPVQSPQLHPSAPEKKEPDQHQAHTTTFGGFGG